MPQYARPDADSLLGNYTNDAGGTTNIFQAIDETSASDADYVRSPADPTSEVYVARLSDVSDPLSSSNHILRVRAGTDQASGGSQIDLTAQLRQGEEVRFDFDINNEDLKYGDFVRAPIPGTDKQVVGFIYGIIPSLEFSNATIAWFNGRDTVHTVISMNTCELIVRS